MDPFICSTCGARVVPPPLQPDGLGLQLRRCACCEVLLACDAFATGAARTGARRCTACASGPECRSFWHRAPPSAPQPQLDERRARADLVATTMGPPPLPVIPHYAERERRRRRRRRDPLKPRRLKKRHN
ncbi:hypothetical protein PC121_g5136 [Phytophthora cactorum]|nr:hypothetical protein PC120_g11692 [Phytophthora cactorum]KAG3085663.1 hypothetical protein PC121_g5136 [Phytophthora cactorum]KAG4053326.1 hypothetical protein PC123_g11510 [Phytophthora cactorum]